LNIQRQSKNLAIHWKGLTARSGFYSDPSYKPSDVEELMFQIVAESHYRRHTGVFQRMQLLGFGASEGTVVAYALDLYRYPPLRRLYEQRRQQGRTIGSYIDASPGVGLLSSFGVRVNERLREFDANEPDAKENLLFPF